MSTERIINIQAYRKRMDERARKLYGDENLPKNSFSETQSLGTTERDVWGIIGNIILIILALLGG